MNRPVQATDEKGPEYVFPIEKLRPMSDDSKRQPVVIVGCGCYSPVTYLHLRMFGEILLLVIAGRCTDCSAFKKLQGIICESRTNGMYLADTCHPCRTSIRRKASSKRRIVSKCADWL